MCSIIWVHSRASRHARRRPVTSRTSFRCNRGRCGCSSDRSSDIQRERNMPMKIFSRAVLMAGMGLCAAAQAQRQPVLKQIDLPHPYYYREMYLPQLTTGPGSVAWSPDSRTLVYSMAGSLWKQKLDWSVAEQLTAGPGYDYQPDCSSDGHWVVYSSYANDAIELLALNLV